MPSKAKGHMKRGRAANRFVKQKAGGDRDYWTGSRSSGHVSGASTNWWEKLASMYRVIRGQPCRERILRCLLCIKKFISSFAILLQEGETPSRAQNWALV